MLVYLILSGQKLRVWLRTSTTVSPTHHELWYGRKPDLSNLKVFSCIAYALVPAAKRRKFADRTEKMRFLGYHKGHRGYKLMERGGNRVFYRTDVTFDEHNFRLSPEKTRDTWRCRL